MKAIRKLLILALLALSMTGCGVVVIQPGEVGVVFNVLTGELEDPPLGPGSHFLKPMVEQVTIYSVAQQQYTMCGSVSDGADPGSEAIQAMTSDGQMISIDVTVIYAIDSAQANMIHVRWQNRYTDDFVRPTVRSVVREMVADYTSRSIIFEGRANLEDDIRLELETRFNQEGLTLNGFLLRAIYFSESFSATIEAEILATMTAEAQATATPIP